MIRRLIYLAFATATFMGSSASLALGACTDTTLTHIVLVAEHRLDNGSSVSVVWFVGNSCGVVETGLLAGTDPAQLSPVGQPVYAGQEAYQQDLSFDRPGAYWIGAYAFDEAGNRIEAVPQMVSVGAPPSPAINGEGSPPRSLSGQTATSLSAQATFLGTDEDFLVPTGNPHLATLKSAFHLGIFERTITDSFVIHERGRTVVHSLTVLSTSRADIEAAFQNPFVIEGEVYPVDPAAVTTGLNKAESQFSQLGFPRPGVYAVGCRQIVDFFLDGARRGTFRDCTGGAATAAGASRIDSDLTDTGGFQVAREIASGQTTAVYLIPTAPSGQRVQKATLRAHVNGGGSSEALQQIRLSGKAPTVVTIDFCFPLVCSSWAEWDFTAEVRALAAQGGGILSFTPDPIPFTTVSPGGRFTGQHASYSLDLAVNYPWRWGNQDGPLSIWFEPDDCPRELKLVVDPPMIRPVIPQTLRSDLTNTAASATVTAIVTSCPPTGDGAAAAPVEVAFEVQPPTGTAESGGHLHDPSGRRTGSFEQPRPFPESGPPIATTTCTVKADAFGDQGMGRCGVTFYASEISGIETIVARAPGFADARTQVAIQVPGLRDFRAFPSGTWRFAGALAGRHTDNHWATAHTIVQAALMATDYFVTKKAVMQINDMSLPFGGMFDICGTWNRRGTCANAPKGGHASHRQGTSVDVNLNACIGIVPTDPLVRGCPVEKPITQQDFRTVCIVWDGRFVPEGTYHCEFDQ